MGQKRNGMKNPSRLLVLLLASSIGAAPLYAIDPAQEPTLRYSKKEVAKIVASTLLVAPVGIVLKYKTDVKKIRAQFPGYSENALKFAALSRSFGLRSVIHNVAQGKIFQLKNPKKALRALAQDDQLVNATAFATGLPREKVRKVLNNPGMIRTLLLPF